MVRRSATTATLQSYGVSVWRAGGWVWTVEMNIDETGYVMNLHECVCVCLRRSVSRERERERKRDMWRCQWCRRGRFNETNGWRARNVDGLTVTGRERERGKENYERRRLVLLFDSVPDRVHSDPRRRVRACVLSVRFTFEKHLKRTLKHSPTYMLSSIV
jgi:hypothetical protein